MTEYYADTSLFVAFLNPRDEFHNLAVDFIQDESHLLVTSPWVIVELGNFLSKWSARRRFVSFVRDLSTDSQVQIEPLNYEALQRGLDLYDRRPDKRWSMTDCISFVIMRDRGLTEALTTDHHFVQAGFKIFLK
jgi:uncharacterized protein